MRRERGEGGFTLVIALVAMLLGSILVAALLGFTFTARNASERFAEAQRRARAAQSGMDQVLQLIRIDTTRVTGDTTCVPRPTWGVTDPANPARFRVSVDGRLVRVQCTPISTPGLIRRVELTAWVAGSGGTDYQLRGQTRARIVDLAADGVVRAGRVVVVENQRLCRLVETSSSCGGGW